MIPLTILIVDDDPDMRLYVRSCLRSLGPKVERVLEAADGIEALALVRNVLVQLIITDVVLPRLNGNGLCETIKNDPDLRHIPVLLISGDDRISRARERGHGFLAKPFNTQQLIAALEQLLLAPRAPPPVRE